MIAKEFPNLEWLKKQIDLRFANRKGLGNMDLKTGGWPNVIINARTQVAHRPDIKGTLSLFTNISGISHCTVDKRKVKVDNQFYFLSNQEEEYTLNIENQQVTETFNIHFGENLIEEVYQGLLAPADQMLSQHFKHKNGIYFFNQLYYRDETFNRLIFNIYQEHQAGNRNPLWLEEQITQLLIYLLHSRRRLLAVVERLPPIKISTKIEIYKRLALVIDYLHTYSHENPNLETLADLACLSKFHFLRLFKLAFQVSPYQYLQNLRLEKAKNLLKHSSLAVHEVALQLGFENSSSFSRLFFQRVKVYPQHFRQQFPMKKF
jgi:AraC family transcriptional regulator